MYSTAQFTFHPSSPPYRHTWLSQANYLLNRLHIMSSFEAYAALHSVHFVLSISGPMGDPPTGFLFLCPVQDFQIGPFSFCWPACAAYWSLDPCGTDRLSPEYATGLGFPPFEFLIKVDGYYWDVGVYEGLRQDVARHLGIPLYQISTQADSSFAYDGEDFDAEKVSDYNSACAEESESEHSPTSACDDSDLDVAAAYSHYQEIVHDSFNGDGGSEDTQKSNHYNMVAEDIPVPSLTLKIVLCIQLVLILFLALSWVYDLVLDSFV
ncbi:hypothetical protein C8R45DRAFT_1223389 [Mycena sanguinolenta]|nr:hypothetical protein C8R45DRAFT_1223389 [Mycena sanguinolenta]